MTMCFPAIQTKLELPCLFVVALKKYYYFSLGVGWAVLDKINQWLEFSLD